MKPVSREFQVFAKPVGAKCNLRCSYCYYLEKHSLYKDGHSPLMSDNLLEKYVVQHISATTDEMIFFSWHGGEPLLTGINFYRKVVSLQKKHLPPGKRILNGIQTNGTLINDEWSRFFYDENFIIGISIDGPGEFHNKHRYGINKQSSHERVIRGHNLLQARGINPEILCVVNAHNVNYPIVVYDYFRQMGAEYITFLPLVESLVNQGEKVSENSVPSAEFGKFLSSVFDEWLEKDIGRIKVQIFEEAARTAFNQEHTLCIFKRECGGVPVVEHNGDFYSCDHYVDNNHRLGNLNDNPLEYYLDCPEQKRFGMVKLHTLPRYCVECDVRAMCNGECPKNRFVTSPDGEPGLNYLCSGYKHFFNHCKPFVDAVASLTPKSPRGDFKTG